MIKHFVFLLFLTNSAISQNHFVVGYSAGGNATFFRNIRSNSPVWGYKNPIRIYTWNNLLYFGYRKNKNQIFLEFESGALGIAYKADVYSDKYPFEEYTSNDSPTYDLSLSTSINTKHRINTNLLRASLFYKRILKNTEKITHKAKIGIGYLKTRVEAPLTGSARMILNDTLGVVVHSLSIKNYSYLRDNNIYLNIGYELSFQISKKWDWNASLSYNQGFYEMIKWKVERKFSESKTGYHESSEQWTYTKLSYFTISTGISFSF